MIGIRLLPSLFLGPLHLRLLQHEAEQTHQDRGDGPRRIPRIRVEVGDTQAQALLRFESAVRGHHVHGWRLEGVVGREHQVAMVLSSKVRRVLRPTHDVVPA